MIDAPEFHLTDRPARPAGQLPWYRRFAKQIVISIAASMIGGVIVNATSLAVGVQYASALVIHTFGDPFARGRAAAKELEEKARSGGNYPSVPVVPVLSNPLRASPAELEARARLKEEERDRKEAAERSRYIARAKAVDFPCETDWTLDDFKARVPVAEKKFKEAEERKPLLAQARELKMLVDEDWDNDMLKAEILEERAFQRADLVYQEQLRRHQEAVRQREELIATGPNGKCPDRRCGHQLHLSPNRKSSRYVCPKCQGHFAVSQARACYTPPPMPREPFPPQRKTPGLLKRAFG